MTTCFCGAERWQPLFQYSAPPAGETRFAGVTAIYERAIVQCISCGHCMARHALPLNNLYEESYVAATYGNRLRATYDRIMALPVEQSDNAGRVARLQWWLGDGRSRRVLDVGSGLGVFLARMKDAGWQGTALDPDERATSLARDVVGVEAVQADWMTAEVAAQSYNLVTFNKVLEHVVDPIAFLAKAKSVLSPGGFVYIEVPDGEAAAADGPEREEFFIEHWHVFSPLSLLFLIQQSGFAIKMLERLREPSGKYTLCALVYGNLG